MLFCVLAVMVKLSLIKQKYTLVYGLLFWAFCWAMTPYAIESNRNEVASYLSSLPARQAVAILVTIECAIAITFAFRQWHPDNEMARKTLYEQMKSKLKLPLIWLEKHYVSLLIFPTLFYCQTQVLYALPGVSFQMPALVVGASAFVLCFGGAGLFRLALPERSMREEMALFLSIMLCVSALFSTVSEKMIFAPVNASTSSIALHLWVFLGLLLLFLVALMYQLFYKRYKLRTNK